MHKLAKVELKFKRVQVVRIYIFYGNLSAIKINPIWLVGLLVIRDLSVRLGPDPVKIR